MKKNFIYRLLDFIPFGVTIFSHIIYDFENNMKKK
jgi:hypothetical protein